MFRPTPTALQMQHGFTRRFGSFRCPHTTGLHCTYRHVSLYNKCVYIRDTQTPGSKSPGQILYRVAKHLWALNVSCPPNGALIFEVVPTFFLMWTPWGTPRYIIKLAYITEFYVLLTVHPCIIL